MRATVQPGVFDAALYGRPSKSVTQRAVALALLHKGYTVLENMGYSEDERAALNIADQCGADLTPYPAALHIHSTGLHINAGDLFSAQESGLSFRMFTPVLATQLNDFYMGGNGSLQKRPLDDMIAMLQAFGVEAKPDKGGLPLHVKGPLIALDATLPAGISSQYISGLFMALAEVAVKPVSIRLTGLKSKPYLELTVEVMRAFGYEVEILPNNHYLIHGKTPNNDIIRYHIENDWSAAANVLICLLYTSPSPRD